MQILIHNLHEYKKPFVKMLHVWWQKTREETGNITNLQMILMQAEGNEEQL